MNAGEKNEHASRMNNIVDTLAASCAALPPIPAFQSENKAGALFEGPKSNHPTPIPARCLEGPKSQSLRAKESGAAEPPSGATEGGIGGRPHVLRKGQTSQCVHLGAAVGADRAIGRRTSSAQATRQTHTHIHKRRADKRNPTDHSSPAHTRTVLHLLSQLLVPDLAAGPGARTLRSAPL
jgi:hypothetical protein